MIGAMLLAATLYLPGVGSETEVRLVNNGKSNAVVTVQLLPDGKPVTATIAAKKSKTWNGAELGFARERSAVVRVDAGDGVTATASTGARTIDAIPASASGTQLGFATTTNAACCVADFGVINPGTREANIKIVMRDLDDSSESWDAIARIAPNDMLSWDDMVMMMLPQRVVARATFKLTSDLPVIAYLLNRDRESGERQKVIGTTD